MNVTEKSVLFLKKDGFLFCEPSKGAQVSFTFSGSDVCDVEIINEDLLTRELGAFIAANNLKPSMITIVLAKDIIFTKKYTKEEVMKIKDKSINDVQNWFEDLVPFETVTSRKIIFGKDILFVATNSYFFLAFKRIFDAHGFVVSAVIPIILPELSHIQEPSLDSARLILSKIDSLKADNLLLHSSDKKIVPVETAVKQDFQQPVLQQEDPVKSSKRLLILIGAFVILMIILGVMVISSFI